MESFEIVCRSFQCSPRMRKHSVIWKIEPKKSLRIDEGLNEDGPRFPSKEISVAKRGPGNAITIGRPFLTFTAACVTKWKG